MLEKALRTALKICPEIAVGSSYLYKDKPYYDEIFLASAIKLAEISPGEIFQYFSGYSYLKNNLYRDPILERTVMSALEKIHRPLLYILTVIKINLMQKKCIKKQWQLQQT